MSIEHMYAMTVRERQMTGKWRMYRGVWILSWGILKRETNGKRGRLSGKKVKKRRKGLFCD